MASNHALIALLLTLSLLSLAAGQNQTQSPPPVSFPPSAPIEAILNAVETLLNCGYAAMGMTLKLILEQSHRNDRINLPRSLTIFAPPDSAFASSGQPSLARLLLHFSPLSLSSDALTSLPFAAEIPTISGHPSPLFVTSPSSDPNGISINRVNVSGAPIYDDGSVVVFAVGGFFDPNFTLPAAEEESSTSAIDIECEKFTSFSKFSDPSGTLKTRGYSLMATFLDLQLMGFGFAGAGTTEMKLTLFAPTDDTLSEYFGNVLEYKSLFLRHLLPCRFTWVHLGELASGNGGNGTVFANYVEGLSMKITKGDGTVMVNGVEIVAPDIYENDYMVIHGVTELIPAFDAAEEEAEFDEISMVKFMKRVEQQRTEF